MEEMIAFFDRGNASYIASDLSLLEGKYRIRRSSFVVRSPWQLPFGILKQLGHCISIIPRSNVVLIHFAGWNSVLPVYFAKLFKKRCLLFLHGTDCVAFPSIGYGNFIKGPLAAATCYSLKNAKHLVAVDASLFSSINTYATGIPTAQGVQVHCKSLSTPTSVLPHGFDPEQWPLGIRERDIDVLTVALEVHQEWRRQLKGIDILIAAAREMPERRFVIIGALSGSILDLPANVETVSEIPLAQLKHWYQRAKCYAQISMSEGFGCALAEAMLCGCVPVVSNVGAMPNIIGDTGAVIHGRDKVAFQTCIEQLLEQPRQLRSKGARERIMMNYSLEVRRIGLYDLVDRHSLPST